MQNSYNRTIAISPSVTHDT